MKNIYIVTGYDKKSDSLMTRRISDINEVYETLKYFSAESISKKYKSAKDLEFDVQSRKSHKGSVIINDSDVAWSICLV